jgi:hypothetical protein
MIGSLAESDPQMFNNKGSSISWSSYEERIRLFIMTTDKNDAAATFLMPPFFADEHYRPSI